MRITKIKILEAKLELLGGNIETAEKILTQARELTIRNGYLRLTEKIDQEIVKMNVQYSSLLELIDKKATYSEKIKELRIEEYFKYVKPFAEDVRKDVLV